MLKLAFSRREKKNKGDKNKRKRMDEIPIFIFLKKRIRDYENEYRPLY